MPSFILFQNASLVYIEMTHAYRISRGGIIIQILCSSDDHHGFFFPFGSLLYLQYLARGRHLIKTYLMNENTMNKGQRRIDVLNLLFSTPISMPHSQLLKNAVSYFDWNGSCHIPLETTELPTNDGVLGWQGLGTRQRPGTNLSQDTLA